MTRTFPPWTSKLKFINFTATNIRVLSKKSKKKARANPGLRLERLA